ncbi:MAG: 50S ribosomal protein L2, partial [Candidatus Diapherotrites archaeon]|nr:50S ribosomal protein L2 [Candidatus Diapherotrites archaeon]
MGKNLRQQRRGKGSPVYIAKNKGITVSYIPLSEQQDSVLRGEIVDLIKEGGRNAVVAMVSFDDGRTNYVVAPEGAAVGQNVEFGKNAQIAVGNVLPLASIPDGCPIFSIEGKAGDGGKFVRGAGGY